jgi:hypothetical protein
LLAGAGGVTSGVVVEGAGEGVVGVAVTGGAVGVTTGAAGGGVAVEGVEGTAPAGVWLMVGAGGVVAAVLTPAEVALREVTGASGEATVVVVTLRRRTAGSAAAMRVVAVTWRVVVVVVLDAGAAASAGGVLAARFAPPLAAGAAATVVGGAPLAPPGVRVVSFGRVAYQPAAARAAIATRPTPTAAGAMERPRRTVVVRLGATKGASPAAPVMAASVVVSGVSWNILRRSPRFLPLRSQMGCGANRVDSESGVGSPFGRV